MQNLKHLEHLRLGIHVSGATGVRSSFTFHFRLCGGNSLYYEFRKQTLAALSCLSCLQERYRVRLMRGVVCQIERVAAALRQNVRQMSVKCQSNVSQIPS